MIERCADKFYQFKRVQQEVEHLKEIPGTKVAEEYTDIMIEQFNKFKKDARSNEDKAI